MLETYERADSKWGWRLTAANGRIVATDGGQGYENRADCEATAHDVVSGRYAERPEEAPVSSTPSSNRVDVVVAGGTPAVVVEHAAPVETVDVAPVHDLRYILLAPTKDAGTEYAASLNIEPVAIVTPRSPDAARGLDADEVVVHPGLADDARDALLPDVLPAVASSTGERG